MLTACGENNAMTMLSSQIGTPNKTTRCIEISFIYILNIFKNSRFEAQLYPIEDQKGEFYAVWLADISP